MGGVFASPCWQDDGDMDCQPQQEQAVKVPVATTGSERMLRRALAV